MLFALPLEPGFNSSVLAGSLHDNKHSSETSSPDAEVTLRDELASNAIASSTSSSSLHKKLPLKSRKEGVMSKSMHVGVSGPTSSTLMSNSLPSYDLQKLFKATEILQVKILN